MTLFNLQQQLNECDMSSQRADNEQESREKVFVNSIPVAEESKENIKENIANNEVKGSEQSELKCHVVKIDNMVSGDIDVHKEEINLTKQSTIKVLEDLSKSHTEVNYNVNHEGIEPLDFKKCDVSVSEVSVNRENKEIPEDTVSTTIEEGELCSPTKGGLLLPKDKLTLPEACKSGKVEQVLRALQDYKGDINTFIDGWTCLHDVCMRECQFSKITEVLLQNGADVNLQDGSGNTPLHIAISYHCVQNVKVLLKYNADIYKLNNEGASPIHTAIFLKDNEILEIMGHQPVPEKTKKAVYGKRKADVLDSYENTPTRCSSPPILKKQKLISEELESPNSRRRSVTFQSGHTIKLFDKNGKIE